MSTLFISDLHLSQDRPAITKLLIEFLRQTARDAEALYILGDLFEVWLGDDMILPDYGAALHNLKSLTESGVPVYIMHGNRDFLMRSRFEELTGTQLIYEPFVFTSNGEQTLLLHGDTLCTDDVEYQKFRSMVRNPDWQKELLAKTPDERLALAKHYREISKAETTQKENAIMDVNQQAVEKVMKENGVLKLIHGHTHRPAFHEFQMDGKKAARIVLGDWHQSGNYLACDSQGCKLINFQ